MSMYYWKDYELLEKNLKFIGEGGLLSSLVSPQVSPSGSNRGFQTLVQSWVTKEDSCECGK